MKQIIGVIMMITTLISCSTTTKNGETIKTIIPIEGTWKLLSGTLIEKEDTTVTDYTKDKSFIKIINNTHFAFLSHDLKKGTDTASATYGSGAGSYSLSDSTYTEHLEYCSDREWEGNDFKFTVTISDDTLIQKGIEKIETIGIDRINIEKYIRIKK